MKAALSFFLLVVFFTVLPSTTNAVFFNSGQCEAQFGDKQGDCTDITVSQCKTFGNPDADFCQQVPWTFKYLAACKACLTTIPEECRYTYNYQFNTCGTGDRCEDPSVNNLEGQTGAGAGTGQNVTGRILPGICQASHFDGKDPNTACVSGGFYKQCCTPPNGTTPISACSAGGCPNGDEPQPFRTTCALPATPPPTPTPAPTGCTGAPTAAPSSPTTFSAICSPLLQSCPVSCTKTCTDSAGRTCNVPGTLFWTCQGTSWSTNGVCSAACPTSCGGVNPTPPPPPPPNPGFCTYNDYRCPTTCQGGGTYYPGGQCIEGEFDEDLHRFICEKRSGLEGCYDQNLNYCGPVTITSRFCSGSQSQACAFPWQQPNPAPFCGNSQWGCYCSSFIPGFGYAPILQQCSGTSSFPLEYCHSNPGDEDTCGPWTGPTCGTQTRTCKTTACQNCGNTRQGTTFTISGNVFIDNNQNGVKDGGESGYPARANISDGFSATTTDSGGNYIFSSIQCGNYVITLTLPANYDATTTNPFIVSSPSSDQIVNFGIARNDNWSIAGNIFIDVNTNSIRDANETNYSGAVSISISPARGTTTYSSPGQYLIQGLSKGSYTVSYTNPPAGYSITYPLNGPPPSFTVGLGPCSPGSSNSASCNGQRLENLNFGINFLQPWFQCQGGDCRIDSGFISKIPTTAVGGAYATLPSSGGMPGLVFSGNATPDFGFGRANANDWVAGGLIYPENYSPTRAGGQVKTSYTFLTSRAAQGNITPTDLSTYCTGGLSNCTLSSALPNGIYKANGNLNLVGGSYTFGANKNFVILVNGDLTISQRIAVPNGSTAFFAASGNITVASTAGEVAASTSPTIQGIYSADKSFVASGNNNCSVGADLRLNVQGTIITNAGSAGGSFQNNRDLCANDSFYPTVYISERPDFIINTPDFLKVPNFTYQEIAP